MAIVTPWRRTVAALVVTMLLAAAACSGSDDGSEQSRGTGEPAPTTGPAVPATQLLARFDDGTSSLELATDGDTVWLLAVERLDYSDGLGREPTPERGIEVWARDLSGDLWQRLPHPPTPPSNPWLGPALRAAAGTPVLVFEGCRGQIQPELGCQDPDPRYDVVTWDGDTSRWAEPARLRLDAPDGYLGAIVAGDRVWLSAPREVDGAGRPTAETALAGVPLTGDDRAGRIRRHAAPRGTELVCATAGGRDLVATGPTPALDPSAPGGSGAEEAGGMPRPIGDEEVPLRRIDTRTGGTNTIAEVPLASEIFCDGSSVVGVPPTGPLWRVDLAGGNEGLTTISGPGVPVSGSVVADQGSPSAAIIGGVPGAINVWVPLNGGWRWQRLRTDDESGILTAVVTGDRYLAIINHGSGDAESEPEIDRRFVEVPR